MSRQLQLLALAIVACLMVATLVVADEDYEDQMPRRVDNSGYVEHPDPNADSTPRALTGALPIRGGPEKFVCKPNCGYYASIGDYRSFMRDNCCTFTQCPYGPEYNKRSYQCFRKGYCPNQ